jgi:hypothetical protein
MLAASPNMPQHLPQYDEAVMALGTGSSHATEEGVMPTRLAPRAVSGTEGRSIATLRATTTVG